MKSYTKVICFYLWHTFAIFLLQFTIQKTCARMNAHICLERLGNHGFAVFLVTTVLYLTILFPVTFFLFR